MTAVNRVAESEDHPCKGGAVHILGPKALAGLGTQHFGGLQGFLGLADGAHGGAFGDASHEPMALVVAAEELALVLAFTHEEQQVSVGGLNVEDGDLGLGTRLADDLEELALAVGLHVQGDDARRAVAPSRIAFFQEAFIYAPPDNCFRFFFSDTAGSPGLLALLMLI